MTSEARRPGDPRRPRDHETPGGQGPQKTRKPETSRPGDQRRGDNGLGRLYVLSEHLKIIKIGRIRIKNNNMFLFSFVLNVIVIYNTIYMPF